jgi:hypothetical protein
VSSADDTLPSSGPGLRAAFDALVTTLHERGVNYAIIGGLAAIQYIRVRATDGIDVVLSLPEHKALYRACPRPASPLFTPACSR